MFEYTFHIDVVQFFSVPGIKRNQSRGMNHKIGFLNGIL